MSSITVKRGDDFKLSITVTDPNDGDSVIDISGWSIQSQIRINKKLTQELSVIITDGANGSFSMSASSTETSSWDIGTHQCDIEFTQNTEVVSSDTFDVIVVEDITYAD